MIRLVSSETKLSGCFVAAKIRLHCDPCRRIPAGMKDEQGRAEAGNCLPLLRRRGRFHAWWKAPLHDGLPIMMQTCQVRTKVHDFADLLRRLCVWQSTCVDVRFGQLPPKADGPLTARRDVRQRTSALRHCRTSEGGWARLKSGHPIPTTLWRFVIWVTAPPQVVTGTTTGTRTGKTFLRCTIRLIRSTLKMPSGQQMIASQTRRSTATDATYSRGYCGVHPRRI